MARSLANVRKKINSKVLAAAEKKAKKLLASMPLQELRHARQLSQEQLADEHLVLDRFLHLLRLVESLVPPPALRHLGHRLLHGAVDAPYCADAQALAHHQPGQ